MYIIYAENTVHQYNFLSPGLGNNTLEHDICCTEVSNLQFALFSQNEYSGSCLILGEQLIWKQNYGNLILEQYCKLLILYKSFLGKNSTSVGIGQFWIQKKEAAPSVPIVTSLLLIYMYENKCNFEAHTVRSRFRRGFRIRVVK